MNPSKNGKIDPKELVKERYSFEDLIKLIRLLRSPEGCPWDREQTHASIRKNFIEETYEVLEAIDKEDLPLLREELGDVLLQVGLHVEMEAERGTMTFEDVITALCSKLVQRHPHVFGDVRGDSAAQALDNWEAIKMRTKGQQTYTESLRSVPAAFPALMRAQKLQSRAARAGFEWPDVSGAWDKLEEECTELKQALHGRARAGRRPVCAGQRGPEAGGRCGRGAHPGGRAVYRAVCAHGRAGGRLGQAAACAVPGAADGAVGPRKTRITWPFLGMLRENGIFAHPLNWEHKKYREMRYAHEQVRNGCSNC